MTDHERGSVHGAGLVLFLLVLSHCLLFFIDVATGVAQAEISDFMYAVQYAVGDVFLLPICDGTSKFLVNFMAVLFTVAPIDPWSWIYRT